MTPASDHYAGAWREMRDTIFSSFGIPRRFVTGELSMEESFLSAILAEPERDDLRLIYADWLEENGQPERSEFIRVQIQLASNPHDSALCNVTGPCGRCARSEELRRRERELLPLAGGWCEGVPAGFEVKNLAFRRGFVAVITCPLATWLEFGSRIVRCQPVEVVRVSDREPQLYFNGFQWYAPAAAPWTTHPHWLPKELFALLPLPLSTTGFLARADSPEAAHAALSSAAIAWAKNPAKPLDSAEVRA